MIRRQYRPVLAVLLTAVLFLSLLLSDTPDALAAELPAVPARGTADAGSGGGENDGDDTEEVYLIGEPAGVRLFSDGVIVAGTADVITAHGAVGPAADAGLREGDQILRADGKSIGSSDDLMKTVEASQGKTLIFTVRRGDSVRRIAVTPAYSTVDNCWRVGVWINDGVSGVGVITFAEPESLVFCAVCHPLGEEDLSCSVPLSRGVLENVRLTGIRKGARGLPGELIGYLGGRRLGTVSENGVLGIFGRLSDKEMLTELTGKLYGTAPSSDVKEGPAELYVRLPGYDSPQLYDIVIEKIERGGENMTRNMTIRVTDRRLLEQTGGIVQGMSGTPVIQSGKFVAALTHVFVSDPTRGYAVFADKLTEHRIAALDPS